MATKTLRDALAARIRSNADSALKALKTANVSLSKEEEASLRAGNLEGFSDQQLAERFNTKVLGILGINSGEYAQTATRERGQEGGSPNRQGNEWSDDRNKSDRDRNR